MDVEVILFDVGGTVFDWRAAVTAALESTESRDLRSVDPETLGAQWRKQSLIEIEAIANETAPWRPFDTVLESALEHTVADLGLGVVSEPDRVTLMTAWEKMPVWPEVPEALARLRRRFFIAPHTILSLRTAAFSSRKAGITWDAIISCDALGSTKLNPQSYARALAAIGRTAEKVCFAAAHPSDLRAARAQGMRTAYVVARLHDYGDEYTDTGFADQFDVVADNFTHLADLMNA